MEGAWGRILHPLQLTDSGRPQLFPGEVECQLLDGIDLELEGQQQQQQQLQPLRSGVLTLTTHRLLWVDEPHQRSGASVPLAAVCRVYPPKKSIKAIFASPRIRIQVWYASDGRISAVGADRSVVLTLVCRGQANIDSFLGRLEQVLQSKAWETDKASAPGSSSVILPPNSSRLPGAAASNSHASHSKWNPAMAGVSGILRKEQEQWEEADKNLQDAFHDLNALMAKAKDMVVLAEKIRSKLLGGSGGQSMVDEEEPGSKQEMQDWLLSVGITSPVTKESAGALYHQQLSRQLADFVKVPLQRSGGMLAMVDAYCLFNRARGTELISPEDLLQACSIWEKLDVPFRMRKFDSGVLVIQSKEDSDGQVFAKLVILIKTPEALKVGISASDAARAFGMAPALAKEYLLTAENQGLLCRDDGADGLRFFANLFKDIVVEATFL
ncbi:hypothetical protein O6H91_01G085500 [Diphasiastrum complanatum]|uniref:Uncharacterized protein n=1 Tax=Diphasiastrum complanatum TaxID=34168 RepID=A0ACC2ET38_DIPCM|nr:hypothetical protein O6H91_01G085500 [Diphasiastrum complanatum]